MQGSNTTTTATSDIQKNLGGGLAVDNKYGPQTTAAVQKFQTDNGLKADGIFGPLTQAAYNKKFSSGIISTGDIHDKAVKDSSALNEALQGYNAPLVNPSSYSGPTKDAVEKPEVLNDTTSGTDSDPIIQQLDNLAARSNTSTQMMVQNIKATKARQAAKVDEQYKNYESGMQLLGIQTNQAQVTPDLLMSHINEAETEHLQKLQDLDNEETKATMDAENAQANNDFKTLSSKMDYIKQIKTEKATALKDYNDALTKADDKATKQGDAVSKVIAPDIYDTLQGLDDADKEPFLVSIAQKFNIPLLSLSTALVAAKNTADKAQAKLDASANKLLSPTEAATLGVPYGTTEADAAKLQITPARYKPTTGGSGVSDTKTKAAAAAEITAAFKTGKDADGEEQGAPKGKDGYVDPYLYVKYLNAWPGTDKEFLTKFPVSGNGGLINPTSYSLLPENIRPKTKTTTRPS